MSGNIPSLHEKNPVRILQGIRDLFQGRSNATGAFTLAVAPATATVVTAINCGLDSQVFLTPKTASAASEYGAGTCYVSSIGAGTFTITHASSAASDRTFSYVALG